MNQPKVLLFLLGLPISSHKVLWEQNIFSLTFIFNNGAVYRAIFIGRGKSAAKQAVNYMSEAQLRDIGTLVGALLRIP